MIPDALLPGRDEGLQPLDAWGLFEVTFALGWTILVVGGAIWMIANRDLPSIRIRNVPLTLGALATLHVYWVVYMLAYPLRETFQCGMEFWMMCITLPFGIALFQASSTQLLNVATLQQRFVGNKFSASRPKAYGRGLRGLKARWGNLSWVRQTGIAIAIGMVFQV